MAVVENTYVDYQHEVPPPVFYTFFREGQLIEASASPETVVQLLAETDPGENVAILRNSSDGATGDLIFAGAHS